LNPLVRRNKRGIYELLFQAVRATILELGKNNLGVTLGFFAVLHTWGQLLQLHPHIHCVIPACGLTPSGEVKVFSKRYLLPDACAQKDRPPKIKKIGHPFAKRSATLWKTGNMLFKPCFWRSVWEEDSYRGEYYKCRGFGRYCGYLS
jgi:hypothetical protein